MAAMAAHQVIIVCGETGSGKTTQLPKIALAMGRGKLNYPAWATRQADWPHPAAPYCRQQRGQDVLPKS
jgi:type IV secretory pathway ATPase VirB11/archaellum biosynthesis ATPase